MLNFIKGRLRKLTRRKPQVQFDLRNYFPKGEDYIIKEYNLAMMYDYAPPISLDGERQFFLPSKNQVGLLDRYLAVFNHARLHTQDGYVQLQNGRFIVETAWSKESILNNSYFFKLFEYPEKFKSGNWFSSLLFWNSAYYHWICDILPRFYQVLDDLPPDTRIIIPANPKEWQVKSLEAIGVDRKRMVEFPLNTIWKFEHLYFAPPVAMTGDHMHEAVAWIHRTVTNNLKIRAGYGKHIYISRGQADRRRIVNEGVLIDYLKRYDFEVVNNECLTFEQQVELFHSASRIVAPHGAGLSNIMFSQVGTKVLEILEKSTMRRCYWTLSNAKGLDYKCFVGNTVEIGLKGEADIEIDMHLFKLRFEAWLKSSDY